MADDFRIKNILVTTDFSDYSRSAFPKVIALARKFDANISILHVIQPLITPAEYSWGVQPIELQKEHERNCHTAMEKLVLKYFPRDISVSSHILHGIPFKEIIGFCRDQQMDLLVIATHGLSGLSHIIFGSTAEKIVRKSSCPVLVVRDPAHKFEMP